MKNQRFDYLFLTKKSEEVVRLLPERHVLSDGFFKKTQKKWQ